MEISRADFIAEAFDKALDLMFPGLKISFAESSAQQTDELFVSVFLRGACDGLNMVPPIAGEDRKLYESARPTLQMPISGVDALLPLDDRFGLHPAAAGLYKHYKQGRMAVIHAAGMPSDTRSHFDAQTMMELGTPDKKSTSSGWLARAIRSGRMIPKASSVKTSSHQLALPAVSLGAMSPISYLGEPGATEIHQIQQMNLGGDKKLQLEQQAALQAMYSQSVHEPKWLVSAGVNALSAISRLQGDLGHEADYPKSEIGGQFRTLAGLVRLNAGVRTAAIDFGGWDTHRYQGVGNDGRFANQVRQLSQAIESFLQDMGDRSVTIVVMSEFGRRLKENANRGTDHGHGNVMLALGNGVNGGKVYGDWRGLSTESLYERADLAVTTDYRQVLSEMLTQRMGVRRVDSVFPGFKAKRPLGIFKSRMS